MLAHPSRVHHCDLEWICFYNHPLCWNTIFWHPWLSSALSERHPFGFTFNFWNWKKLQRTKYGVQRMSWTAAMFLAKTDGCWIYCERQHCHGEAVIFFSLATGWNVSFSYFHVIAGKHHSRSWNSLASRDKFLVYNLFYVKINTRTNHAYETTFQLSGLFLDLDDPRPFHWDGCCWVSGSKL